MRLPIPPDNDEDYTSEIARKIINMHFEVNCKLIDYLHKYGNHIPDCVITVTLGVVTCTCGWEQLKKGLSL